MQRYEVEAIFEARKEAFFKGKSASENPIAIILGGQPACGKSTLIRVAEADHPLQNFLTVNGDLYRPFHPNKELIKDPIKYPIETQIFSSVFTEKLIEEAIKRKCNIIIEGTMRNPDVPLKTAQKFKDAGFRVEAYIIAAPKEFTQLGLYNRYQEEILKKGQGRLADIDSHNKAVNGLMKSANQLYSDKAVDKISIHTYLAKERIKDFNLVNGEWSCKSMPSIFIDESRSKQMKNKEILNTNIQRGKELSEYSSSGSGDRTQKMYLLLSKTSGVCAEDTAPAVCCCAPKRHAVNMEDMFSAISASSESHLKTRSLSDNAKAITWGKVPIPLARSL